MSIRIPRQKKTELDGPSPLRSGRWSQVGGILFSALERFLPQLAIRLTRQPRTLGRLGEELAARHLAAQGWQVIGRSVRTPTAEIDLVCRRAGLLICVEVKTGWIRTDRPQRLRPRDRLRPKRLARQRRAALALARRQGLRPGQARVDLFEWTLTADRSSPWKRLWKSLRGVHLRDVGHSGDP